MKNAHLQHIIYLFALALLLPSACKEPPNPCIRSLHQRDEQIVQKADSLIRLRTTLTLKEYRVALETLRAEEKQLFGEVDACDFGKNLQAWNYWYRGRLKFPGKAEQELKRLERDSIR